MSLTQAERLVKAVERIAGNFGTILAILIGVWIVVGVVFCFYLSKHSH